MRTGKDEIFQYAGGVQGFVEFINQGKTKIHDNIFYINKSIEINPGEVINVEVSMQWTDAAILRISWLTPTTFLRKTAVLTLMV